MSIFTNAKDRLIETMVLPILNRSYLAPYGRAQEIRVDTESNSIEILVELKGDDAPLRVRIGSYEYVKSGDDTFVIIHAITTSREWMTTLAERYLLGRPLRLPREFGGVISRFA